MRIRSGLPWLLFLHLLPLPLTEPLPDGFTDSLSTRGEEELRRVRSLAAQPRYGECWSRALEELDTRCRELTADTQSRMALRFTHCHLERSGRTFPSCPEGSEVSQCTTNMDAVAFNAYTEFFTHTQSICHYLQAEAWQHRAQNTIHRLTESSAGVAEQLESTRRLAEDLVEAQSAALLAQEKILLSGEQLQHTLQSSTQGLREVFTEMSASSREQQVALSEMFNRVAFLQSFILSESHTLGCVFYNGLAMVTAFLLSASQRTARARLILFGLVFLNVYLERRIYATLLDSDRPGYLQMELVNQYVSVLRRVMAAVGVVVLVCVALRYRDLTRESLDILTQLRETQSSLQRAAAHTESLSASVDKRGSGGRPQRLELQRRRSGAHLKSWKEDERGSMEQRSRKKRGGGGGGGEDDIMSLCPSMMAPELYEKTTQSDWNDDSVLSSTVISSAPENISILLCPDTYQTMSPRSQKALGPSSITQHASVSPGRRPRRSSSSRLPSSSSSSLVQCILVSDRQPRYSLRSRTSLPEAQQDT